MLNLVAAIPAHQKTNDRAILSEIKTLSMCGDTFERKLIGLPQG
jgi:hypothetical protein